MNHNVHSHARPPHTARRRAASAVTWPTDTDARNEHDRRADAERGHTPHNPGAAVCLCPACHLKFSRFPRRQDGRIVLPDPLAARSDLGAVGGGSRLPAARVRTRSNVHVDDRHTLEDQRGLGTHDMRDDRGEGTSTGGGYQLSRSGIPVTVLDSRPYQLGVLQEFGAHGSGEQLTHADSAARGAARNRQGSITDRARPRRASKPYDPKPSMILDFQGWVPGIDANADRPEPWPRIATVTQHEAPPARHPVIPTKAYPGQQHLPTAYEEVTSHQSSSGLRETNPASSSTRSGSRSRTHSDSYNANTTAVPNPKSRAPKPNPTPNPSRPSSSHSFRHNPSLAAPQANQQITSTTTTNSQQSYFTDADLPPPTVHRFSSRPRNPQPEVWSPTNNSSSITAQAADETKNPGTPFNMGYYEGEGYSGATISAYGVLPTGLTGPAGEGYNSQAGPSSASHQHHYHAFPQQQQQQHQQEYSHPHPQAHHHHPGPPPQDPSPAPPLRFQNPVTPQIHAANTARAATGKPRALSVVHVKWDSERKKRQGYFAAQDDGEEKSPFRHYNKMGCDYDS